MIKSLFQDIDRRWTRRSAAKDRLRIIGSTALVLQSDYVRGTKDSDVLETNEVDASVREQLLTLAGRGTSLHKRHRIYVDVVAASLPFLPRTPRCHAVTDLNSSLLNLELEVLDVVDVIISKLKRFNPNDVADIEAMIDRGLVPHAVLLERFRSAVDGFDMDSRAVDLPAYVAHLNAVERDMLLVPESEIELPSWI